ncbi:MAG: hypothetical protein GY842_02725 [bacterium]|nr:hypothetical protein [bacterium]
MSRTSTPQVLALRTLSARLWGHPRLRCGGALALLVPVLLAARCSEPGSKPQAVPTSAAPATTTQPVLPTPDPTLSEVPPAAPMTELELPPDGWLRIESLKEGAAGGWVNGWLRGPNRIGLETEDVVRFSMDLSQLELDWSRRVWVRVDTGTFELTHKRNPVIHLQKSPMGAWDVVPPPSR